MISIYPKSHFAHHPSIQWQSSTAAAIAIHSHSHHPHIRILYVVILNTNFAMCGRVWTVLDCSGIRRYGNPTNLGVHQPTAAGALKPLCCCCEDKHTRCMVEADDGFEREKEMKLRWANERVRDCYTATHQSAISFHLNSTSSYSATYIIIISSRVSR